MVLVRCPFCKHFIGITIDGNVLCKKLGQTQLMRFCRYFELGGKEGER